MCFLGEFKESDYFFVVVCCHGRLCFVYKLNGKNCLIGG